MSTLRAKESFTAYVDGQAIPVSAGELVDSSNVVVANRESLFDKVEDYVLDPGRKRTQVSRDDKPRPSEVLMERATADPGERRSVSPKPSQDKDDKPAVSRTPAKVNAPASKEKKDGEV